jgi:hypothetical protein
MFPDDVRKLYSLMCFLLYQRRLQMARLSALVLFFIEEVRIFIFKCLISICYQKTFSRGKNSEHFLFSEYFLSVLKSSGISP